MLRRLLGRGSAVNVEAEDGSPAALVPFEQRPFLERASGADRRIIEEALPFTMTGVPRLQTLVDAVRHVHAAALPGGFAECGVWRGGSVLAMILTLQELGVDDRDIHLYDTFEGMTAPTDADVSDLEPPASETWEEAQRAGERAWSGLFDPQLFDEGQVRARLLSTGYPAERLRFVKGPVEETLPGRLPGPLALLRLDTDWYESTLHELEHLYPLLAPGGVLIVDDFGHWQGARKAVEEYFHEHPPMPLLTRIDYTARIGVKP